MDLGRLLVQSVRVRQTTKESTDTLSAARATPRGAQAALVIVLVAIASIGAAIPIFRDRLQDYFSLSTTRYGLLLNMGAFVGVAGSLAGGPLMARIGPRRMLMVCLAGAIAGMALAIWPGSWILFLTALAVTAFFVAPMNFAMQAYLSDLFPDRRRKILSLSLVASSVFFMLFPLLAELLLSFTRPGHPSDFGWVIHGLYAAAAAVLLLGLLAMTGSARVTHTEAATASSVSTLSTGAIVLLVVLLTLHGTADTVLSIWMPRVLSSTSYAVQPFLPGAVMSAYSLGYVVSRFLLSLLPENRWRRRLMVFPGLLGGTVLLAGILTQNQAWTAVGFVAGAFLWSVECPVFIAALTGAGPRFGNAIAIFSAVAGLTTFALGTSLGALADHLGEAQMWKILFIPASLFPLAGLGGLLWVRLYGQRQLEDKK